MSIATEFEKIAALDLDPIKVKLMHVESGEGWSLEKANAVEQEYRRFLYLMKTFPSEQMAPLMDVDTFWHYHILDTQKYAIDCEEVFGYFLHHFPYIGLRGEEDLVAHERLGQRMAEIYEQTFGESYIRAETVALEGDVAYSAASAKTAYSAAAGKTAYSAASAKTAYSAAAGKTAYSAASAKTAYSAAASKTAYSAASAKTAYSAAAGKTAYSAASVKLAYSAAASKTAYSAMSANSQDPLFTVRPTLADYKATVQAEPD